MTAPPADREGAGSWWVALLVAIVPFGLASAPRPVLVGLARGSREGPKVAAVATP